MQRRPTLLVSSFKICAFIEQVTQRIVVTVVSRPVQRRQLPSVLCVDVVAQSKEERQRDRIIALSCAVHRIDLEEVHRVRVCIHLK